MDGRCGERCVRLARHKAQAAQQKNVGASTYKRATNCMAKSSACLRRAQKKMKCFGYAGTECIRVGGGGLVNDDSRESFQLLEISVKRCIWKKSGLTCISRHMPMT